MPQILTMLIPSPDGIYMAKLQLRHLNVYKVVTGELLFSIPLSINCTMMAWDQSSCEQEYRLAVAAHCQCLTLGFTGNSNYYLCPLSTSGPIRTIQWTPMVNGRGRILVRLATQSVAPDSAQLWINNNITGQYPRPKSQFVSLPSLKGWALLHSSHQSDRVIFFFGGRFLSDIVLPTITCHSIVGCIDSAMVAVADTCNLYIVGTARIIVKLANLAVEQITWMKGGQILAVTATEVLIISPTFEIKSRVNCQNVRSIHVIAEKQILEVTNNHNFHLNKPALLLSGSGKYCAIKNNPCHFVLILNASGAETLIDYRDSNVRVEWHQDSLYFIFEDYGAIWSPESFRIVEFTLGNVLGVLPFGNQALVWNNDSFEVGTTFATGTTDSITTRELFNQNENQDKTPTRDEPNPEPVTPFLLQMAPLRIPTVSPYMNDYIPEDTFYYKRLR